MNLFIYCSNWSQEPNNYKGLEDCGLIYASGEYNDMGCASHAAAICEIKGTSKLFPLEVCIYVHVSVRFGEAGL